MNYNLHGCTIAVNPASYDFEPVSILPYQHPSSKSIRKALRGKTLTALEFGHAIKYFSDHFEEFEYDLQGSTAYHSIISELVANLIIAGICVL